MRRFLSRSSTTRSTTPLFSRTTAGVIIAVLLIISVQAEADTSSPPFLSTVYMGPDMITQSDPTAFEGLSHRGGVDALMYDYPTRSWEHQRAYYFIATYRDSRPLNVYVHEEFETRENAEVEALKYAREVGRLPYLVRRHLKRMNIRAGEEPMNGLGAGYGWLMIHVDGARLEEWGALEEMLLHIVGRMAMQEEQFYVSRQWRVSRREDPTFISKHAQDHPETDDVAASLTAYMYVTYLADRLRDGDEEKIRKAIPNRLLYFRNQGYDGQWCPIVRSDCTWEIAD